MNSTNEKAIIVGDFPKGIILAWYAKSGSFPLGWAICDGTNGTPDLRKKFIRGASDMANVGAQGGNEKHYHSFSTDSSKVLNPDGWNADDMNRNGTPMTTGFDHTHRISGSTDQSENLPPYVDVLYIMKT